MSAIHQHTALLHSAGAQATPEFGLQSCDRQFVCISDCFKACCNAGFKIGAVDTAAGVKGSRKESLLCVVLKQLKSHDCSIEELPQQLAPVRAAGDLQVINQPINQLIKSFSQSINQSID